MVRRMNEPDDNAVERSAELPIWEHVLPFVLFFFVSHMLGESTPFAIGAGALATAGVLVWRKPWRDAPIWAHFAPFAAWISLMMGLGEPSGATYAIRTVVGAAMLLAFRPWRWYAPMNPRNIPLALAVGAGVFVVWVGFESSLVRAVAPGLAEGYERYLVGPLPMGFGALREPLESFPYRPSETGWTLFAVRMVGTSVVIAVIEEFFWRGFLYRWLCGRNFLSVSLIHVDKAMIVAVAVLFGLEHAEWFAGIVCGVLFAWVVLRTGDIWAAALAHGVTNFLLGLYVLHADAWHFW